MEIIIATVEPRHINVKVRSPASRRRYWRSSPIAAPKRKLTSKRTKAVDEAISVLLKIAFMSSHIFSSFFHKNKPAPCLVSK